MNLRHMRESSAPNTTASPALTVRRPRFDLRELPRHWLGGKPVPTHLANSLSALFPAGERFFIRSVRRYADRVSPELRRRVLEFAGQEASHQRVHQEWLTQLTAQGYDIDTFLAWYERMAYEVIEPKVPEILRLSTTAALEHLTATLGARALSNPNLHEHAAAPMATLLRWHAAEEVEHKAVAYDVLMDVDDRWVVRAAGLTIGMTVILWFWRRGFQHLMAQEAPLTALERAERLRALATFMTGDGPMLVAQVLRFLEPGFHPNQIQDAHLAEEFFATFELPGIAA